MILLGRSEEKKIEKKLKLLNAAEELFIKKGVNITAIDEIVKKAGIAKGTFYLYFKDKYDLLDSIILKKSGEIVSDALSKIINSNSVSFVDGIISFTDSIIDSLKKNKDILTLVQKNLSVGIKYFVNDEQYEQIISLFERNGYSKEAALKKIYLITNIVSSVCYDAILTEKPYSIDEIKPEFHSIIKSMFSGGVND